MTTEVSDDDFQEILAQTRHFVRTAVVPREQEILAEDRVPDDLREQAKKMGLFGYAIPQEWGGLGLNLAQDVELAMELGYTSLALRSMFGTNNGIAGQVLVGFGTNEQKARWLEPMATGDVVASFALTEPGAGSNPSGLRTKPFATAQIGSSTARSASSPTPPLPICSSSLPAPGPPIRMERVSPSSLWPPTRQASRSA
jgi:acyl-CoA dehydrogenase